MNIYSQKGDRVVVTKKTAENGYLYDKENIVRYLVVGEPYEVEHIDVSSSHTTVYLTQFPGIRFNSVNFKNYRTEPKSFKKISKKQKRQLLRDFYIYCMGKDGELREIYIEQFLENV